SSTSSTYTTTTPVPRAKRPTLPQLGARGREPRPSTLLPAGVEKLGCEVARTLPDALRDADAVMMLRIQQERIADARIPGTRDYARVWGLSARTLELLPSRAVVLHPGPVNRRVGLP